MSVTPHAVTRAGNGKGGASALARVGDVRRDRHVRLAALACAASSAADGGASSSKGNFSPL